MATGSGAAGAAAASLSGEREILNVLKILAQFKNKTNDLRFFLFYCYVSSHFNLIILRTDQHKFTEVTF